MIAAVVPAAGKSARMGTPKLTLPVEGGGTVIARVVSALKGGGAKLVVVVVPPIGETDVQLLMRSAVDAGALVYALPEPTGDMRETFEAGLAFLERNGLVPETVLACPGDSVGLTGDLVARVVERATAEPGAIVLPVCGGRRGHPLALPWPIALECRNLPPDAGLNALRDRFADRVVRLAVDDPGGADDLDTPDDYRRWKPS